MPSKKPEKKQASVDDQAARARTQQRKERNRERNQRLHEAKNQRRADGTLTETDRMWEAVKAKFRDRQLAHQIERSSSDWVRNVGRVKGRRITAVKVDKPEAKPADNGKTPKKAKKERVQRPKKEKAGV